MEEKLHSNNTGPAPEMATSAQSLTACADASFASTDLHFDINSSKIRTVLKRQRDEGCHTPNMPHTELIMSNGLSKFHLNKGAEESCSLKTDWLSTLSAEVLCHILSFLSLPDVLKMECQNKTLKHAVQLHLKLRRVISFCRRQMSWLPSKVTDHVLLQLARVCPQVEYIYGFHPHSLASRRHRLCAGLSVPGCLDFFLALPHLCSVEISDPSLLEAILLYLPHLKIIGVFKNRQGPSNCSANRLCKLSLPASPQVTTLHLSNVEVPEIPRLSFVQHLFLRDVCLTHPDPFRHLIAPVLQTFVMANCSGPANALKHVRLVTGLATSRHLSRLELVKVPFLGGLFQHIVEDSRPIQGFQQLHTVVIAACQFALELDLGFLAITAAQKLQEMSLQPSLSRDSLFLALKFSGATFPCFNTLHIGYTDAQSETGKPITEEERHDRTEVHNPPPLITDVGMQAAACCFPGLESLTVTGCPHLHCPDQWLHTCAGAWHNLQNLTLHGCHALRLSNFETLVSELPGLVSLTLEFMFREPPRGCSRVGLSVGTGLGVSSAMLQNQHTLSNNARAAPAFAGGNGAGNDTDDDDDEEPVTDEMDDCDMEDDFVDDCTCNNITGEAVSEDVDDTSNEEVSNQNSENETIDDGADDTVNRKTHSIDAVERSCCPREHCSKQDNDIGMKYNTMKNNTNFTENNSDGKASSGLVETKDSACCTDDSSAASSSEVLRGPEVFTGDQFQKSTAKCSGLCKSRTCQTRSGEVLDGGHVSQGEGSIEAKTGAESSVATNRLSTKFASKGRLPQSSRREEPERTEDILTDSVRSPLKPSKGKALVGRKKSAAKRTRSLSQEFPCQCRRDKWSQVTAEEIREACKQIQEQCDAAPPAKRRKMSLAEEENGEVDLTFCGESCCRAWCIDGKRRRVSGEDKATSTSDPVYEEDIVQIFHLKSSTLVSLSVHMVGVTDIILEECPKLKNIRGSACRVLKHVQASSCSKLERFHWAQSFKLETLPLLQSLAQAVDDDHSTLVVLRPMMKIDEEQLTDTLIRLPDLNKHVCVLFDYSPNPTSTLHNHARVATWMNLFSDINRYCFEILHWQKGKMTLKTDDTFERIGVYQMKGENPDGSMWQLATDYPWLRHLANLNDNTDSCISPESKEAGVFCPEAKGHLQSLDCIEDLVETGAFQSCHTRGGQPQLYLHTLFIYVNMCDTNGDCTPDPHV